MNLFDIAKKQKELSELEAETAKEGFWTNNDKKDEILAKISSNKKICTTYLNLESEITNVEELSELVMQEFDESGHRIVKEVSESRRVRR